ncbi:MAG: hypothetical protein ACRDVW_05215 [Acidimicrobiales bacterium]
MRFGWRAALSSAVVALFSVLVGGAAYLGVSQSPAATGPLDHFLAATKADGTVAFTMTLRTVGFSTVQRVEGKIDFAGDDGISRSVYRTPGTPAQWTETVVVDGKPYERPASDGRDGPDFAGPWQQLGNVSVPPFAPLVGTAPTTPIVPHLERVGHAVLSGLETTKYLVAAYAASCPTSGGEPTAETERTWIWVDPEGRIRRWENEDDAQYPVGTDGAPVTLRLITVTTLGRFGVPVNVTAPTRLLGPSSPTTVAPNPFAGCLITPG